MLSKLVQTRVVFHYRLVSTSCCRCNSNEQIQLRKKKQHWSIEEKKKNNIERALEHFDDFYSSVFGPKRWPSLRLALLSPTKYVAIPNTFTGNVDGIIGRLEEMGSYSMQRLWEEGKSDLVKERKNIDLQKDLGRISRLEKTLESIALTKKAEEMEVMYQNDPDKKGVMLPFGSNEGETFRRAPQQANRAVKDPYEAAFMPPTKLKGVEEFAFDSDYYAGFLPASKANEGLEGIVYTKPSNTKKLEFPKLLKPYTFEPGSALDFPGARLDPTTGLREYICVNGASIAPILALDLKPDVDLLDLCAAPGTKSLMSLMTLSVKSITCNDLHHNRFMRIKKLFREFLGSDKTNETYFTRFNAMNYPADQQFGRILADVPCLSDKTACTSVDNNIFKTTRTKERLALVKVQTQILNSAFNVLSSDEGSAVVYSTCTLSPVENDGVVMQALKHTEVPNLTVDLYGLLDILKPFEKYNLFRLNRTRFGVLIEPSVFSNFGPMYVSRIVVRKTLDENPIVTDKPVMSSIEKGQSLSTSHLSV